MLDNNRGATLIEVLVVSFFVMMGLVALANLTFLSVARNRNAKDTVVGVRLAQEGLEWFRSQRTQMGFEPFFTSVGIISSGSYCLPGDVNEWTDITVANNPKTDCEYAAEDNVFRWVDVTTNPVPPASVRVEVSVWWPGLANKDPIKATGDIVQWQK